MTSVRTPLTIVSLILLSLMMVAYITSIQAQGADDLISQATSVTVQVQSTQEVLTNDYEAMLLQTSEARFGQDFKVAVAAALPTQEAKLLKSLEVKQQQVRATAQAQSEATRTVSQATQVVRDRSTQATQVAISVRQTITALPSPTALPTATPSPPQINVLMEGCTTGADAMLRRVGEVTSAYVTVQNVGGSDARNVVVTLRASDEASTHPDQQKIVQYLPVDHQVTLDLATGTQLLQNTAVQIIVVTDKGVTERTSRADCKEIDAKTIDNMFQVLRLVIPIPKLRLSR